MSEIYRRQKRLNGPRTPDRMRRARAWGESINAGFEKSFLGSWLSSGICSARVKSERRGVHTRPPGPVRPCMLSHLA